MCCEIALAHDADDDVDDDADEISMWREIALEYEADDDPMTFQIHVKAQLMMMTMMPTMMLMLKLSCIDSQ